MATTLSWQAELARLCELARRHLDMDLAYVAEVAGGRQFYRAVTGDGVPFDVLVDSAPELTSSYCMRMLTGQLPRLIPDTAAVPGVAKLGVTSPSGVGSYLGVPIELSDGTVYGSFACVSAKPHQLGTRDVHFMAMLAELVSAQVEIGREHNHERNRISTLIDLVALDIAVQPVFDVNDGRCVGVEALSRFPAAYGSTQEVFESAHSVGLGLALERLALVEAMSVLPGLAPDQFLAVNLTPQVAFDLSDVGATHPELLRRLVLEITEHSAVDSYAGLRRALRSSREQGLRLAIDDAGAGYASLKHVVELEPDIIKVDRSLVDGVAGDRARRSAVSAFVLLALDMGATVIAEGVENPSDLEAIKDLGVDAAQGFLLGRPTTDRRALNRWQRTRPHLPRARAASPSALQHD